LSAPPSAEPFESLFPLAAKPQLEQFRLSAPPSAEPFESNAELSPPRRGAPQVMDALAQHLGRYVRSINNTFGAPSAERVYRQLNHHCRLCYRVLRA
jgi:hypothetical protein